MSQSFSPKPSPRPGPVPGPAERPSIDPAQIGHDVGRYVEQVDELRRSAQDRHDLGGDVDGPAGTDLSTLDAQADLLERAHDVLTGTLEQLDRV